MQENYKKHLLIAYFEAHKEMLENLRFDLEKSNLIELSAKKIAEEYNLSKTQIDEIKNSIEFPEIGFDYNEEYLIIHPTWNENSTEEVNPITYYGESYSDFMCEFHTKRLNNLLDGLPYQVSIFSSGDCYLGNEDDEDDETEDSIYYGLSMYTAYLVEKETGEEVDDTATGCYCSVEDVIDEIESFVEEILELNKTFSEQK